MKAEKAIKEFAKKVSVKATFAGAIGIDNNWLVEPLTVLISEHYYPKEFVTWLSFGSHPFVYWFDEKGQYYTDEITDKRWSIEDLYNHWKENER